MHHCPPRWSPVRAGAAPLKAEGGRFIKIGRCDAVSQPDASLPFAKGHSWTINNRELEHHGRTAFVARIMDAHDPIVEESLFPFTARFHKATRLAGGPTSISTCTAGQCSLTLPGSRPLPQKMWEARLSNCSESSAEVSRRAGRGFFLMARGLFFIGAG